MGWLCGTDCDLVKKSSYARISNRKKVVRYRNEEDSGKISLMNCGIRTQSGPNLHNASPCSYEDMKSMSCVSFNLLRLYVWKISKLNSDRLIDQLFWLHTAIFPLMSLWMTSCVMITRVIKLHHLVLPGVFLTLCLFSFKEATGNLPNDAIMSANAEPGE